MKVLITGGAGYLGTALAQRLSHDERVDELVVYDNLARRNHNLFLVNDMGPRPLRFVRGDVLDSRRVKQALAGVDVVFHLAARVTTPFADADFHGLEQVNHWGTAELGYRLEEAPCARLIYTSSASVYGSSDTEVDHTREPRPKTAYAIAKRNGEKMLDRLGDRLGLYQIRSANVYGYNASMRFDAVVNRFMFDAHYTRHLTVHGSGRQHRAFVHIDNAITALVACGMGDVPPGTYDLVERNLSVLDIAETIHGLYDDLEMLFLQQDLQLRDLRVKRDERLAHLLDGRSFEEQLTEFKERFAFLPGQVL